MGCVVLFLTDKLADNYLYWPSFRDQFCSFVFTLSNLYFVGCVYVDGFSPSWNKCNINSMHWPLAYFGAALPLFIRLVQSIKRYADSRLLTHLINVSSSVASSHRQSSKCADPCHREGNMELELLHISFSSCGGTIVSFNDHQGVTLKSWCIFPVRNKSRSYICTIYPNWNHLLCICTYMGMFRLLSNSTSLMDCFSIGSSYGLVRPTDTFDIPSASPGTCVL